MKQVKVKAQELYDFREVSEFCSGTDLQEFFEKFMGEKSPPGDAETYRFYADDFVKKCADKIEKSSPSLAAYARKVKKVWRSKPTAFTKEEWDRIASAGKKRYA